jgi:PBP1b-binding outer membrane lipoprotein LpoB
MKHIIVFVAATAILASGCTATIDPTGAEVVVPAVKIKTGSGQSFCPPGQAKKGHC